MLDHMGMCCAKASCLIFLNIRHHDAITGSCFWLAICPFHTITLCMRESRTRPNLGQHVIVAVESVNQTQPVAGLSVAYTPGDGARSYRIRGALGVATMLNDQCGFNEVHNPLPKKDSLVDAC